jgi:hypothetical protein
MEFYNINLLQYQQVISIPDNPRDITYNECVKILKETKSPIFLEELVITACKRNEQLKQYLGDEIKLRKNWKLRPILDMLLNHTCIKQVQQKPIALEWINEPLSSSYTAHASHNKENNIEVDKQCEVCDACDDSGKPLETQNKSFICFYCDKLCPSNKERIAHIDHDHQGRVYYPTPQDFENRLEK